jgi:hypothetical protein
MIVFDEIKKLFPAKKYQCGILSQKDTYQLGRALPVNRILWKAIKSSLIILQYTKVACDYSIKPDTEKILRPHFKDILLITLDFKTAAIKAGLASRGYNSLAWNPHFGFDCKITAWGFFEEIVGYQKPRFPEWLPFCKACLKCHQRCPSQAFLGKSIKNFKLDAYKCMSIIDKQVDDFKSIAHSSWNGVPGGVHPHCRICQEQLPCKVRASKIKY